MLRLLIALVLSCLAMIAIAAEPPEKTANTLLDKMQAGDYAAAEALFAPAMREAIPQAKLQQVWESLLAQIGTLKSRDAVQIVIYQQSRIVTVPLHFDRSDLVAQVGVDADGKVTAFLLKPAQTAAAPAPAVPADANFTETDFSFADLPGTLALPKGNGPFPAVVLVHGSGSHDRDETIGPNKPFLDIARGLAAQGIAVLRYDMRSKVRPQDFASRTFGIDDETTHDAVAAIAALAADQRINHKRIYVFGHSQGAMMAPRIAMKSGKTAGVVMLAAPARSELDIVIEQNQRLAMLDDGKISDAEQAAIAKVVEQVRQIRDPATDATSANLLGQSVGYWRSVDAVHPLAEAKAMHLPMLLLQGGRDIQVVDADWELWQHAFTGSKRVTFEHYPSLNHLGIAGDGPGTLAEYTKPGHVDAQLINDTATWIKAH